MAVHHTFKRNQKVYVELNDGTTLVDRYIESSAKFLTLQNNKYKWNELKCTTIYKPRDIR